MISSTTKSSADDLIRLFLDLSYPRSVRGEFFPETAAGYLQRDLVCTPFGGNYGGIAGWVICVNGSPPKGTLIVSSDDTDSTPAVYTNAVVTRRLRDKQHKIVSAFYNEHLKDAEQAFTIPMKKPKRSTLG